MSATGVKQGPATRRQYTSGSSADTTTWAAPNTMADWALIVGAGSTVLTDETGTSVTLTTDAALPNVVIPGPWKAFTSTTATRVTMGNGAAPPAPAVPASAVPSTTSAVGGVKMSVAPAAAASPIAVGTNDSRVTTIEAVVSFSGSDGSLTEQPFPHPGCACTLTDISVQAPAAASASDTNYVTITFAKRNGSGGGATTLVAGTTQATGGVNAGGGLLAFQWVSLGTPSATAIAATDVLTIKSVKTSSGVASGPALVRFTFTVP